MVFRVYSEKRPEFSEGAIALLNDIRDFLGIKGLSKLRVINRYDVEGIDEATLIKCIPTVFSEPQVDFTYRELDTSDAHVFAVAYLPGQFDQRADSASQCISLVTAGEKPTVRSAAVYLLYGELTEADIEKIKSYIINPIDSMEAELSVPENSFHPLHRTADAGNGQSFRRTRRNHQKIRTCDGRSRSSLCCRVFQQPKQAANDD